MLIKYLIAHKSYKLVQDVEVQSQQRMVCTGEWNQYKDIKIYWIVRNSFLYLLYKNIIVLNELTKGRLGEKEEEEEGGGRGTRNNFKMFIKFIH